MPTDLTRHDRDDLRRPRPACDYLLGLDTFDAATGRPLDNLILVQSRPGVAIDDLRSQLTGLLGDYLGAQVLDTAGYQSATGAMLDQLLNLTIGLLVLAVVTQQRPLMPR